MRRSLRLRGTCCSPEMRSGEADAGGALAQAATGHPEPPCSASSPSSASTWMTGRRPSASRGSAASRSGRRPPQIAIKIALAGVGFITGRNWRRPPVTSPRRWDSPTSSATLSSRRRSSAITPPGSTATGHGLRRDLMERAAQLEPWTRPLRTMDHPDFDFALMLGQKATGPGAGTAGTAAGTRRSER